jgi:hypothetical protein
MIRGTIFKKEYYTKYALRVANPRAADRPAGGWPPEGRIVMTPDYYPFSVCLIMAATSSNSLG